MDDPRTTRLVRCELRPTESPDSAAYGWTVRLDGQRVRALPLRADALRVARELARDTVGSGTDCELIIFAADGRIDHAEMHSSRSTLAARNRVRRTRAVG